MTETTAATDERLGRYAEVLSGLNIVGPMRRIFEDDEMADALDVLLSQEVEAVLPAVLAVADAEQAELRAEADAQRGLADMSIQRALRAEAAVARAGALTVHLHTDLIYRGDLLAALADPERHVCPECEQGKHANCDGTAWDDAKDEPTSCTCHLHEVTP